MANDARQVARNKLCAGARPVLRPGVGFNSLPVGNSTRAEQIALLRAAIARSGLSNRQFARRVLLRDERTLRRWVSGKQGIPQVVLRELTRVRES